MKYFNQSKGIVFGLLFCFFVIKISCVFAQEAGLERHLNQNKTKELLNAKGFVFNDNNLNGLKDKHEKGIKGVLISNGKELVSTDAKGFYSIPVGNDTIIFYVKPRGWKSPVNNDNIPQFFYIHKPNGSPKNVQYPGVAPTGKLPAEINFPLYKSKKTKQFKVLIFGDPQPYSFEDLNYYANDIVKELIDTKVFSFGMTMGDIVGNDLSLFSPVNKVTAKIGIPWYYVLGNHDINFEASTDELSDESYERIYGPPTYAFVYGGVHFIVIDNVIYKGQNSKKNYIGGLREDQLQFVENYLKTVSKKELVVLNMHIPLAQNSKTFRQSDQKRLFDLLKDFPYTLSISGHTHTQNNVFFHQESSDWDQNKPHHHFNVGTTSGSWWKGMKNENGLPHSMMRDGTPNGYAYLTFKGSDYMIDWKVAGSSKKHKMNIFIPQNIVEGATEKTKLVVNYFMGSEKTRVTYRIKGVSDWIEMKREFMEDPFFVKLKERFFRLTSKQNSSKTGAFTVADLPKTKSSHIWTALLDKELKAGIYVVEVKIKDRYQRYFFDEHIIRVNQKNKPKS